MSVVERETVEVAPVEAEPSIGDVLTRAADLLGEFGWCQNSMGLNAEGRGVGAGDSGAIAFCAQGAICRAQLDLGGADLCAVSLAAYGSVESIVGVAPLYAWNNAPGRTKAEVVAALRAAAKNA